MENQVITLIKDGSQWTLLAEDGDRVLVQDQYGSTIEASKDLFTPLSTLATQIE